jgi:hypothetical protein
MAPAGPECGRWARRPLPVRHINGTLIIGGADVGGGYQACRGSGNDNTLPVCLRKARYDTMSIGPYLHGYDHDGRDDAVNLHGV